MEKQDRLHSLDAVRAYVLLLGIVLHATMSFVPGLGIPTPDSSPSTTLAVTFYVIHIFRMSAFFMIAGFFAHMVFHRKRMQGFVRDRRKRILMPLLGGWAVFFPLTVLTIVWGAMRASNGTLPAAPEAPDVLVYFPLSHLWFLYLLLWMYGLTLLGRRALDALVKAPGPIRSSIDRGIRALVNSHWAPIALALPLCIYLYLLNPWPMWFGIPTPEHSLIPTASGLIAFGTAFVFGWLVHRQVDLIRVWERHWAFHLSMAVGLTIASLALVGVNPMRAEMELGWTRFGYAACYTLAIWHWTFGLIGAALRFFSEHSSTRRYIADSSYWLYLAHLPLVFFLQVAMSQWDVHWSVKFPIILATAIFLLLLSYRYWVRSTYIGEVLNGRRYPRTQVLPAATPVTDMNPNLSMMAVPPGFPPMVTADSPQMNLAAMAQMPARREIPQQQDGSGVNQNLKERIDEPPLAALQGVHKHFGAIAALDGVNLDVRPGELLAVLGPNGAGKSTAISLLLGLQTPDTGSASLFGQATDNLEARRRIGVMMQEVTLAAELRVREQIDLVCSYYPAPYSVEEVIKLTHIEALADRPYGKLSGGQKRQVQFAMALCGRPQLLFLDEPTVGLDVRARALMWETIRELVYQGCSVVLTTHYLEEAEALADRVIVMVKGKIIATGSVGAMRAIVSRKRISCVTSLSEDHVRAWPEVEVVVAESDRLLITTTDAEAVVRRLLTMDEELHELEVKRAGLSEAFTELTQESAP